mmetsp:Transcript_1017/g.2167  ORF Transcript_1017/g.2167 Transcript_1017/m.2167 type:complete len:207 (+) Transcript_1017:584-1204(+)
MFLPTLGPLSTVLATCETSRSNPYPLMAMSNLPSNLAKCRQLISSASSCGVSASRRRGTPICSHAVTASSVSERKTLPLDQHVARGSICSSLLTVVPLPVPERPCSTSTQPLPGLSPRHRTISAATCSAVLPSTSILVSGSTAGLAGMTPFSIAIRMPAASFSSSSASRRMIPSISACENWRNVASPSKTEMISLEVVSSPFSITA